MVRTPGSQPGDPGFNSRSEYVIDLKLLSVGFAAMVGGYALKMGTAPMVPSDVKVDVVVSGEATLTTRHEVRLTPKSFTIDVNGATFDVEIPTQFEHNINK